MKLSDYVIKFIEEAGVKDIFMLPGGGCIHLVDSVRKSNLNYICNLHEQGSSIAAEAYSQYTNNLGACLVTTGPGGTNTVTGVAGAWLDSIPMIFISGQVPIKDRTFGLARQGGFQEVDIAAIVKPITKYVVRVSNPLMIKVHLEKALYEATNGRPGPVWIDIPLDVQSAQIIPEVLNGWVEPEKVGMNTKQSVTDIINDLNFAKRPVILAGNGIRLSKSVKDFLQLADILKIPVLTTWKAIDFFDESHPLYIGRPGLVGQRGANFSQQNSDFVLSIGARLDLGQTAYKPGYFAPNAKKAIVDVDPNEIAKIQKNTYLQTGDEEKKRSGDENRMKVDYSVEADAGEFIREFIEQSGMLTADYSNWVKECKRLHEKYPICLPEYWKEKDGVNNYVLVEALSRIVSNDVVIIPSSSGCSSEVTMQSFKVKKGQRIFNTPGLGAMGYGIPAAIGACVASDGKETICLDGDGGFIMNIQELETVKRLGLPIKFFILNNEGYVSIRNTQNSHFDGKLIGSDKDSGLTLPDWKKIANAFGIQYTSIDSHKKIDKQLEIILDILGPVICEVKMSFEHTTAPKASIYKKDDGTFSTKPMEDLDPPLDREEFEENTKWCNHYW